ncbi:TPA: GFA family protein [Providencia alcalifaciens]
MPKGQCLCGSVKLTINQPIDTVHVCHCGMCLKWNGGPGMTIGYEGESEIEGSELITCFASSEWAERAFCKQCGTHLFYHLHSPSTYYLSAPLFDESKNAKMGTQIYIDCKPNYYNFVEKTPMLTEQDILNLFTNKF